MTDAPLPKFRKPPVTEVVMSVQFDPITALTPVHLGSWWMAERRAAYPIVEERPPLDPSREEFGNDLPPTFSLRLGNVPPTPATWFFSAERDELLQVQRDRFSRNWLRPDAATTDYPSYEALLPAFIADFESFGAHVGDFGLGVPLVTQCEITYINPIPMPSGDPAAILSVWSRPDDGFLPTPEDAQVAARFVIPGTDGEPIGRLYVHCQPVRDSAGGAAYLLTLSAKGRPIGPGLEGAQSFLDVGHEWIVRGFTSLTTQPMHEKWERYQ